MKYYFVNKKVIKLLFGYCFFYPIGFLAFVLPIIIMANKSGIIVALVIYFLAVVTLYIITFRRLHKYLGMYRIESTGMYFKRRGKLYYVSKNDIVIATIEYDSRISPFESEGRPYIIIRIKGEKNAIPIWIRDETVIKKVLSDFDCRREPNNYKFEWE